MLTASRRCSYHNHLDEFEKANPRLFDQALDIEDMVMEYTTISMHQSGIRQISNIF